MSDKHLPDHWIQKLCVHLSIPGWISGVFPHQVIRFFTAWQISEGGTAQWNPLNTTNHVSDAWGHWQGADYNSITVANYNTPFNGITATAATILHSANFTGILADLRAAETAGYTAEEIVNRNADAIKTWGTSPKTMLSVLATLT